MIAVAVISVVGILNLFLGLTTLLRARKEPASFFYFLISLITVLWIVPLSFLEFSPTDAHRVMLARFAFIGPTFLPLALYGFISNFPSTSKNYKQSIFIFFALAGFIFLNVALLGNAFITGVSKTSGGQYVYSYGYQYTIYFIYLAGGIFYLLGSMYKRFRKSQGLDQLRLKYLLTGFGLSAAGALLTNMVLPMLGLDIFATFGPVSTLFLFYFTTQAILYHRLFDIGTFVSKIMEVVVLSAFFYLVIFLIRSFEIRILNLSFYDPLNIFIDLVFALIVAVNIKGIQKTIGTFVGSILAAEKIKVEEISRQIDILRTQNLPLQEFLKRAVEIITNEVPKLRAFMVNDSELSDVLQKNSFLVGKLYLLQELQPTTKQHNYMNQAGYGILVRISDDIPLIMYEKSGQIAYTKQEIDAVSFIVEKLKVTLAERTLLEQTNNFNSILQKKVTQQTKKLVNANAKLRELDKAKSDFISMASHQLRTPISVIRGYLSMIMSGDLGQVPSELLSSLERVLRNTDQLNNIVEDILNASRIEQARLVINRTDTDVVQLVKNAAIELHKKASDKGLLLETNLPKRKVILSIDQTKVFEAVLNLIDNAIAYTPKGSVTVSLTSDDQRVLISVADTGIGIPPEKADHIFKRFSRLDNAKLVRPDGTGIGLFIAKKVVDAHSGKIWFSSNVGEGTTFFLQLPKKLPQSSSEKSPKRQK